MFYDHVSKTATVSTIQRSGGTYVAEILGTFILVLCIFSLSHQNSSRVSVSLVVLVAGMLLSTSSTMFANPQVTIARIFTYSDAGIRIYDAIIFIVMQFIGGILAVFMWKYAIKDNCKM